MRSREVTREGFEELFRRTASEVHAYLRRRVGADADDLLGDVFVIAWQRRRDLPEPRLHRAWLYGVARRLVLAHGRQLSHATDAAVRLARQDTAIPATDERRAATVRDALATLAEVDRELITLTVWEGLGVAEAALALGMRPGAARVRLHRARKRLAEDPTIAVLVAEESVGRSRSS